MAGRAMEFELGDLALNPEIAQDLIGFEQFFQVGAEIADGEKMHLGQSGSTTISGWPYSIG
jgi:hypothetical protein